MANTAIPAEAASELAAAKRRLQRELDEHALERRQEALFTLAKKAIHDPCDVQPLLLETAAIVAEALDATCGSHCEPARESSTLRLVSAGRRPADSLAECKLPEDARESFARYAEQEMKVVTCEDLLAEQRFSDAWLLEQDLRSGLMCPLVQRTAINGKTNTVLGVLAVLDREPREFTPADRRFLETVAEWLTLIVSRVQAERELERARRFAATLTSTVDALVVELDPQGQIQWVNSACEAITGFLPDELTERTLWNALLIPDEVSLVKEVFARLKTESESLDFDSHVLTKHGERRRMAWSCSAIRDEDDKIHSILGTGLDVTDKLRAEQELKKLRQDATAAQADPLPAAPTIADACPVPPATLPTPVKPPEKSTSVAQPSLRLDALVSAATAPLPPAKPLPSGIAKDRRSRPRCAYPYKQLVGPLHNGRLPAKSLFREMQCREIAAGGFSYLAPMPPDNDMIVVAFGVAPSLIYLSAKVQHVTPTDVDGITMFAVGCQYIERVSYNGR